jgi:alpha-D-xyloside xylohydrolase
MGRLLTALSLAAALAFHLDALHAAVADVHETGAGIESVVGDQRLRVAFVTDRIVRVTATRNRDWSGDASMMRVPVAERPGAIAVSHDGKAYVLRSAKLTVTVDRATGAIAFRDAAGRKLLGEDAAAPHVFARTPVFKSMPDPATVKTVSTVDGEREVAGAWIEKHDRDAWRATARFRLQDGEALYGLGLDETADLDLRGKTKRLYQHNLRVVVPFLVSTKGYGLLFDTYSALTFADGADGMSLTSDVVNDLDYYFVLGPSMDGAIAGYRQLTGAATMLPDWAYGYVQSKERYKTQQEVVDTVRQFRERAIPLDVIVQDWNYWAPGNWGSVVPDATRYPDIGAMTKAVHDLNARVMISIWPNPSPNDPPGRALKDSGYLAGGTNYVDFFRPEAADAYFRHVWTYLGRHGIDAWWCDSTEPEVSDWTGDAVRAPDADARNIGGLSRVMDPQYLNAYARADARSFMRNWRRSAPDQRLVNLTRSGYAGSQSDGAVVWSGDISARWPVFAQQVATLQNYSAAGNPYVTMDVGGFFVHKGSQWFWNGDYDAGVDDKAYRELYTRWLEFGAFLPMFRSHGTDTPREPWHFGAPGTPFYDAILQAIRLRYRMLPYIYSQAGLVHLKGASFIRPVAFAYPEDASTHDLKSQMLFGDAFMVSPVTTPMYYTAGSVPIVGAAKTRPVYLPRGTWIDFWTGNPETGGRTIAVDAPLARMPVHVRAGSIVPLGPVVQTVAEGVGAPLELRVYPGADGHYTYYEDAGEGWGYERGEYALVDMRWDDAAGKLTIAARQGSFPGMKPKRLRIVLVGPGRGTGIDAADGAIDLDYVGKAVTVDLGRAARADRHVR